jgi:hypothetical protein
MQRTADFHDPIADARFPQAVERDRFESSHATRLKRAVGQYFGLRA